MQRQLILTLCVAAALAGAYFSSPRAEAQSGDLLTQVKANEEMLKKGAELFSANCVACHGAEGKGDGVGGAALNPKPRNFHAAENWKNGRDFAGLYKTLEEGLPGTPMGSYSHLSAKDRVALIQHIRNLNQSNYPEVTAKDMELLEKDYNFTQALAQSDKSKAMLPIDTAIAKLIEEARPAQAKVEKALAAFEKDSSPAAVQARQVLTDPGRALTSLSQANSAWRSSPQEFSKFVIATLDQNGFKSQAAGFSAAEWQGLHNYLKRLI